MADLVQTVAPHSVLRQSAGQKSPSTGPIILVHRLAATSSLLEQAFDSFCQKPDGTAIRSSKPSRNANPTGSFPGQILPPVNHPGRHQNTPPSVNTTPLCSGSWIVSGKR